MEERGNAGMWGILPFFAFVLSHTILLNIAYFDLSSKIL